jgi:ABC-type histidine transport system ATPase subunit
MMEDTSMDTDKFRSPDFTTGSVELRFEHGVVCIYGTVKGLKRLSDLCLELIESPQQGHIHIEGPELNLLTKASERGAIAVFRT